MKLFKQVLIIALISFIGEMMHRFLPFPVPSSIYGLLLMLLLLMTKVIKLESVDYVGKVLIKYMPIMFVPAGVGLVTAWDRLYPILIPVAVITFVSTIIVMIVSGKFTEKLIK